jgi:hypothetical protein
MVDIVDELAVRRFDKETEADKCKPLDALEAAKKWILERPEDEAVEHLIIFTGRTTPEGASATRFFQAGSYASHAQIGLIESGKMQIYESG